MRSMILLIVLFLIECSNQPSKNRQKEEQFGIRQPMFWWMLLANRPKDEDPNCGGDPLGTLFGLNKDRIYQFTPLAENQEIVTDYIRSTQISFISSKEFRIAVTAFEIKAGVNDCDSSALKLSATLVYCSGTKSIVNASEKYTVNQTVQFAPMIGMTNFLYTGVLGGTCYVKLKFKGQSV